MNGKPSWTAYLCVLTYCAVAILALNSYQARFKSTATKQLQVDDRPIASSQLATANQYVLHAEVSLAISENTNEPEAALLESCCEVAGPKTSVSVDNVNLENVTKNNVTLDKAAVTSSPRSCNDDSELLGCLAADLAKSAMKEGSIVLPRQIVQQQPQRSAPPMKLASFRLPRSTPKSEPPQPASLLVNYQSRLLAAATDVRARLGTYLRWVRFCATVRGLISDFEKCYLQPVLERVLNRQPAGNVLFDADDETYDMMRYAIPIAYPG